MKEFQHMKGKNYEIYLGTNETLEMKISMKFNAKTKQNTQNYSS